MNKLPKDSVRLHKGISFVGVTTCFICHDGTGRIFMEKRRNKARDEKGCWDVGGGGLDWGLTAEQNVIKEVQEEYTAVPLEVEFMGYRDVFRTLADGTKTHWLALDFAVRLDPADVKVGEPDKFDDSGWFGLDSLPTPLHSQILETFDKNKFALQRILNKEKN